LLKNILIASQECRIFRESHTKHTTACIIVQQICIHCGDRKTPLIAMNYIYIAPSSTQDIVALLALLIVLLLPAFVLVGIAVAQMALTEQLLGGISIVSLVVFVIKVGEGTFGTKVMLHLRMGQQAKGGEGHHRKKDRRKIDNRSISSYYRTRNYRASNRQSFGNFIPFALNEHREPSIFCHSYSSSQENSATDIQSLKTHQKISEQGQSSRQGKMVARAGQTTTKVVPVQAGAMTSALCLFSLPHQLGAPYFDRININEFLTCWENLTMDWTDGQRIK